jgi:predicted membrane channel-forming protein YqfA (hemolysin III family)
MLHNESVNVWSHLLGAIFVVLLTIYTTMFIHSHKDYLLSMSLNKINEEIKNTTIFDMLPNLNNIT